MKKQIFVTGCTGCIGHYVLDELKAKCAKQEQACKVSPQIDQTALIGTLLTDSKNTRVGDILQQ